MDKEKADAYWKANISLISMLLAVWAFVSYGMAIILYPVLINVQMPLTQVSVPFWFAQQGSMFTFVILIIIYAVQMDKIDQKFDVNE
jgi:putative solute:sodium symporter small subunit